MYSDTKTSCESVTTATKANDDPELVALHRNFRTQKDRLLAWGLDWSDASADIDESLTEAGFSDVVASVMSSIQEILNEAERLQHVGAADLPPKGSSDLPSKDSLSHLPLKTHWTDEDISRSNALLKELTSCIDTLYDLSRSRRNMTMNKSTSGQPMPKAKSRSKHAKSPEDSKLPPTREVHDGPTELKGTAGSPKQKQQQQRFEFSPFTSFHAVPIGYMERPSMASMEDLFTQSFNSTRHLFIDRSALELSGASHAKSPPPYEAVAASANSRVICRMKTAASPFLKRLTRESTVPVLAEFTPMLLEAHTAITIPASDRLEKVQQALDQLVENARVSHLGLLRFIGYYIDMPNARYAFIYLMPTGYFPLLRNPSHDLKVLKPKPLVSLFHSGDDHHDIPVPNLESRFRLAYNLVLAVLHLRSQNVVHGNINSNNILLFPGLNSSSQNEIESLTEDLRRPYLTSLAQFSGNEPSPEPLSSSMYRHPDDKRQIDDDAAWAYDLYSLGLVLLEIGLWTPISRLWKMKYNNAMFKQRIENVYVKKLGAKCGNAYLHAVQLCLDAPNFHLSTQPMEDLSLRVPQVFRYPALDLTEPDSTFSFSVNFLFTISKIIWRCCSIDIFSAPPAEDLDDCLPLALGPGLEIGITNFAHTEHVHESEQDATSSQQAPDAAFGDAKSSKESQTRDKKVKKRTLKKLTNVEIPQEHLNEWNFHMMPRLSKLLQKVLKDSSESCSASLMMTGETVDTAKTTICVTCSNVKKVRAALKKYFVLDKEGWELIVLRDDIRRSKVPRRRRRKPKAAGPVNASEPLDSQLRLNPHYQQRPLCGASIGAFRNEEHLPPVSYGGAILVDGMPFGMTVHHMLDAPSDDEESETEDADCPPRSAANWPKDIETSSADFSYTWCEEDPPETNYEFQITDDEEDGDDRSVSHGGLDESYDDFSLSDDSSLDEDGLDPDDGLVDDDDAASIGDTAGVEPGEEPRLIVTQPAIDDVHDDFFPCPEDKDDEHLASHSLGYVHASSGVRRWTRKGIKHEIDWALIKINEDRMDPRNIIYTSATGAGCRTVPRQRHGNTANRTKKAIHLSKVAPLEDLGGLKVHCCGRTSGLQSGQISKAMTLVKMRGRQSFSTSFCVDGNFGGKSLDSSAFQSPIRTLELPTYYLASSLLPSLVPLHTAALLLGEHHANFYFEPSVPGDSGAWVFDMATGRVCGHVLAWSEKSRTAYIAPMEVLLEDIARTLGATKVTLPESTPDEQPVSTAIAQTHSESVRQPSAAATAAATVEATRARPGNPGANHGRPPLSRRDLRPIPDQFPVEIDLGRLSLSNLDIDLDLGDDQQQRQQQQQPSLSRVGPVSGPGPRPSSGTGPGTGTGTGTRTSTPRSAAGGRGAGFRNLTLRDPTTATATVTATATPATPRYGARGHGHAHRTAATAIMTHHHHHQTRSLERQLA